MATSATSDNLQDILSHIDLLSVSYAIILLIAGYIIARIAKRLTLKASEKVANRQQVMLISKSSYYLILLIFIIAALQQLGFSLTVLLSAAGILTVAIGFAAQTSMSNIISGLFLIAEQPFVIGDTVTLDGTTGEVIAIDLLSVKLRTFDNTLVRIANEAIIKSKIINLTFYATRRFDFQIGVAYDADLAIVNKILQDVASNNEYALKKPEPSFSIISFADSSINIQFSVWCKRENLFQFKCSFQQQVKMAFDKENIEIPFPQRVVHRV